MTWETNHALSWLGHWLHQLLGPAVVVVVVLIAHRLTLRRERANRQHAQDTARKDRVRKFRAFVEGLKSEAADRYWQRGSFSDHYHSKTAQLFSAADNVANDFTGDRRNEFDKLVTAAAGFAPTQLHQFHERQQLLVPALDAILKFLDKAYLARTRPKRKRKRWGYGYAATLQLVENGGSPQPQAVDG